jgi:hypothetical protein
MVSMPILHAFVVEEHSGIVVFIFAAIVFRLLVDLRVRNSVPSARVGAIRNGADVISYMGALAAVIFLVLSAVTGYLIQPFSILVSEPILLNKSLVALGALFFWAAFLVLRYRSGPSMWKKRRLYAIAMITATLGFSFTALSGSIGAELTLGHSVMDPIYQLLSLNLRAWTLQPIDIGATIIIVLIGIVLAEVVKRGREGVS